MAQVRIAGQDYEVPIQFAPTKVIRDQASATVLYVCTAAPGSLATDPVWQCYRQTVSGNVTTTEWADGGRYTQIAANRASLTYA